MSKKTNEKKNSFKKDIKQLKTIIMPLNAKQTGRYDKKVAANQIYIPAGVLMIIAGVILLVKSIFSDKNESEFSNIPS